MLKRDRAILVHLFLAGAGDRPKVESGIVKMMRIPAHVHVADMVAMPREDDGAVQLEHVIHEKNLLAGSGVQNGRMKQPFRFIRCGNKALVGAVFDKARDVGAVGRKPRRPDISREGPFLCFQRVSGECDFGIARVFVIVRRLPFGVLPHTDNGPG